MSEKLHEIPKEWVWTQVGEIYNIIGGGTPETKTEGHWHGDIAWITSADIYGLKDIRPRKRVTKGAIESSATNLVPKGSLIVVTRVGLGKVALTNEPLCFSQDSQALIGNNTYIYSDYALYYLSQATQLFKYQNRGTTIAGVTKKQLSELPFPLPPFPEQQRIVEALEQQLTRLDAGVVALRSTQKKLKRYRASVLKAAVEGKLTQEWRKSHPEVEPASELLKRILQERHAKWKEGQIAKGRDLQKVRYEEPVEPDVKELPEVPERWCWATFEQISERVTVGFVGTMVNEYVENGIPFLRGQNVRANSFDPEGLKFISEEFHQKIAKSALEASDILVVRSGAVGTACVMPDTYEEANCSDLVIVKQPIYVNPFYIAYYMNSTAQSRVRARQVGIALTHFNTHSMAAMPLPLAPLAEQEQIVSLVEERLSIISTLESTIEQVLKRAERMRQSILHRAFTGKLVAQDPNDEPASVLLERIRREREEANAPQKLKHLVYKENGKSSRKRVAESTQPYLLVDVPDPEPVDAQATTQGGLWD